MAPCVLYTGGGIPVPCAGGELSWTYVRSCVNPHVNQSINQSVNQSVSS